MRVYILSMEFRKFIAKRLKDARLARGFTQEHLAELSSVHSKAIAKYETEVIIPTAETLKKLAEALEVSADYFLFDQAKMDGIPRVQDPNLYDRYLVLETLNDVDRESAFNLIDALIARKRLQELAAASSQSNTESLKKPANKEAHA